MLFRSEVLFTDYIAEHLSADGRGGVIVPNGIVATTQNAYVKLRRFLVEDSLVAVVSLPSGVFKPYSGVKTSILLLDKNLARRTREILFLKITADGFDLGDKRTPIAANDLPEAERVVKLWLAGKLNENVESPLAWKAVEKTAVLENRSISLQAEPFFGDKVQSEAATNSVLSDLCENFAGLWKADDGAKETVPCKVIRNTNFTKDCRLDMSDVALLDVETKKLASRRLQRGDIIVEKSGGGPKQPVGRVVLFDVESNDAFSLSNFCSALRVKDSTRVDAAFLYWMLRAFYLKGGTETLQRQTHGIRNLDFNEYLTTEIPLPPLEEQRRIVAEIEGYQKVLDGARQILAGYRPRIEADPEWETVPLGEVCQVAGSIVKEINKRLPYIGSDSIEGGTGKLLQRKSCEEQGILGPVYEFKGARLLYSKIRPYLNKLTVTDFHGYCSSDVYPLVVDEKKALPQFVMFHLLSEKFLADIAGFHERVSIPKINREQLFGVEIPLPPLPEQRRIVSELDAEAAQMEAVRGLLPRFEAKIQRTLARVWGNGESE